MPPFPFKGQTGSISIQESTQIRELLGFSGYNQIHIQPGGEWKDKVQEKMDCLDG